MMALKRQALLVSPLMRAERVRQDLPGLFSLLLFLSVTALIFRSWEFALLVTASLGFHEMGHALALIWYRLDFRIHFGVVGAYTWSRAPERAALSQKANTYVHLAGPLFSLALALGALALHRLWQPESLHLLVLANFSAQVGFLNLLPLGDLTDGGKALRRMAHSAVRRREQLVILLLGSAALVGPLLASAWPVWRGGLQALPNTAAGFVLIGIWLAASLVMELRRQQQKPAPGPVAAAKITPAAGRPMTSRQLIFLALLLWDMLAALLMVILATPFWLQPSYVLGSLRNVELLLHFVFNLL
jgi:hypothetical protein